MINTFILILFFIYSCLLFSIDCFMILFILFIFNFIISIIIRIPIKKHFIVFKKYIIFVLFIIICNLLFSNIISSLKVGIKLFLAIDMTYIIGTYFNNDKIRLAFKYLFYPLKIFKVDIDNLTLIISISLAFIPILSDEIRMIKLSLNSKGVKFNLFYLATKPHIYLITFLNNLFNRLDDLEKTLTIKAY